MTPLNRSRFAPQTRTGRRPARARLSAGVELLEGRQLPSAGVPRPDHVVVVVEENHAANQVLGNAQAPYINALAGGPNTAVFTHSFGVTHPSQPNYLALFSGSTQGVTGDGLPANLPFTTPNLGASLVSNGLTFGGYSESTQDDGQAAGPDQRKHTPWVNWQGSTANAVPAADNLPLATFPTDYSTLPTVSFVVPNLSHDMHQGTVGQGDSWLRQNLGGYVEWAKTHNSLLILTFDEDDKGHGNHIVTMFVGPMVQGGKYAERIDHVGVLRTLEDMYGLPYAGSSGTSKPVTDVWAGGGAAAPAPQAPRPAARVASSGGSAFSRDLSKFGRNLQSGLKKFFSGKIAVAGSSGGA